MDISLLIAACAIAGSCICLLLLQLCLERRVRKSQTNAAANSDAITVGGSRDSLALPIDGGENGEVDPLKQIKHLQKSTQEFGIKFHELKFGKMLGKGSQGEVFKATWRGSTVAVKKVDTRKVAPEIIEEFCSEAHIMRRLRHPTLTLFMGVSLEHPHLCIVTELVARGSLFDLIHDEHAALTWSKCLGIALDVARGMNYLHSHTPPILHRDLKSLNILVDENWRGKVADFGMTRFQEEGTTMTQCGSPLWMAPEMIRNDPYDEKSDVYSFAICLWEMYTRKIPYRDLGLNPSHLVVKVVKEHLRPPIPKTCPRPFRHLMEKCWHPSAERRPTFQQILAMLEKMIADPAIVNHKPMSSREGATVVVRQDKYNPSSSSPIVPGTATSSIGIEALISPGSSKENGADRGSSWKLESGEVRLLNEALTRSTDVAGGEHGGGGGGATPRPWARVSSRPPSQSQHDRDKEKEKDRPPTPTVMTSPTPADEEKGDRNATRTRDQTNKQPPLPSTSQTHTSSSTPRTSGAGGTKKKVGASSRAAVADSSSSTTPPSFQFAPLDTSHSSPRLGATGEGSTGPAPNASSSSSSASASSTTSPTSASTVRVGSFFQGKDKDRDKEKEKDGTSSGKGDSSGTTTPGAGATSDATSTSVMAPTSVGCASQGFAVSLASFRSKHVALQVSYIDSRHLALSNEERVLADLDGGGEKEGALGVLLSRYAEELRHPNLVLFLGAFVEPIRKLRDRTKEAMVGFEGEEVKIINPPLPPNSSPPPPASLPPPPAIASPSGNDATTPISPSPSPLPSPSPRPAFTVASTPLPAPPADCEYYVGVVSEHMSRGTLASVLLDKRLVLDWDTTLQLLIDAASGLAFLAGTRHPVVHQRLDSSALLVDKNWRVKVSQYAFVDLKAMLNGRPLPPTTWSAPEYIKAYYGSSAHVNRNVLAAANAARAVSSSAVRPGMSVPHLTLASNIYSFGMIMWQALVRKQVFDGKSLSKDLADAIVKQGQRPPLPQSLASSSKELHQLIERCWSPDPKMRPSAVQVLEQLQKLKAMGPPKIVLQRGVNAHKYRKAKTVFAYRSKDPVTILKDWGTNIGKSNCIIIFSGEDDVYLCDEEVFNSTYERVDVSTHMALRPPPASIPTGTRLRPIREVHTESSTLASEDGGNGGSGFHGTNTPGGGGGVDMEGGSLVHSTPPLSPVASASSPFVSMLDMSPSISVGHEYRKTGTVLARCMDEAFSVKSVGGTLEHGMAGDYLVQNEQGDQWTIEARTFLDLYERWD